MPTRLPDAVIRAIHDIVLEAQANNEIRDAYGAVRRIQRTFPKEEAAAGELIAVLLRSGLTAIELSGSGLVIEVILPAEAEPVEAVTAEANLN